MMFANSFDLWQKDTFFSAAEEVQQSADIMESAYRTWLTAKREDLLPQHLDKLGRDLQMALGTAKWQLEEFERAVCQSYRNKGDDITITRHRQFVSAIEEQISDVETALKESLKVEGKTPFRWVNLDEKECDDLARFLSGTRGTSQTMKDGSIKLKSSTKEDCSFSTKASSKMEILNQGKNLGNILRSIEDINCFVELQERKNPETNEINYLADQMTNNRKGWSLPDTNALEIVVDSDDRQTNTLIEATPKEKGFKRFLWRSRSEGNTQMKLMNWINHMEDSVLDANYEGILLYFYNFSELQMSFLRCICICSLLTVMFDCFRNTIIYEIFEHLAALERRSWKSETTCGTSVASQIYTFCSSFDANHFFICALFAALDVSHVEVI